MLQSTQTGFPGKSWSEGHVSFFNAEISSSSGFLDLGLLSFSHNVSVLIRTACFFETLHEFSKNQFSGLGWECEVVLTARQCHGDLAGICRSRGGRVLQLSPTFTTCTLSKPHTELLLVPFVSQITYSPHSHAG